MARTRGNQEGQIRLKGASWVLVFYEDRIIEGKEQRIRTQKILAPYTAHPYRPTDTDRIRKELADQINAYLRPNNGAKPTASGLDGTLTLEEFIEQRYFPRLEQRVQLTGASHIEPSTVHGYKKIFTKRIKDAPVSKIRVREFTAQQGQLWLESLPQDLSHKTHLRHRAFLVAVFAYALQQGVIAGVNPVTITKAGGASKARKPANLREKKIQASNSHAYTLAEVAEMLDKLPEPARTICAMAAFTGLTRSELPALKWEEDFDGKQIRVQRKKWQGHIGTPKTEAREAGVYVMPLLQKILAKYKKEFPPAPDGWMFYGDKEKKPIDMDNLSRRVIPTYINGAWFGWHSFRRGLGTRLNEAGVDDKDIQSILRHSNVSTTQAFYILPNRENAEAGLKKLGKTLQTKYGIKA